MRFERPRYDAEGDVLMPQRLMQARPAFDNPPLDAGWWHAFAFNPPQGQEQATVDSFIDWITSRGAIVHSHEVAFGAPATRIVYYLMEDPHQAQLARARRAQVARAKR